MSYVKPVVACIDSANYRIWVKGELRRSKRVELKLLRDSIIAYMKLVSESRQS